MKNYNSKIINFKIFAIKHSSCYESNNKLIFIDFKSFYYY